MPKDFWNSFQLYLSDSKLPPFLVEILKLSGYDSPISIELIDREKIIEIENFIEKNFGCTSALLKCTVYEHKDKFCFLPGHVTLLLGLKKYAKQFLEKTLKVGQKRQVLSTISEEYELLASGEVENLKIALIEKLLKYCRKLNICTDNLTKDCIQTDLEIIINTRGETVYKCVVDCNLCATKVPCIYNKYWQVSNLERHLKTHEEPRKPDAQTAQKLSEILKTNPLANPSTSPIQAKP